MDYEVQLCIVTVTLNLYLLFVVSLAQNIFKGLINYKGNQSFCFPEKH